jgi:hypothetical protein
MTRYWIERFAPGLFVPAALLIALAARIGSPLDPIRWSLESLLALLLLAQFRLWDDLADRERDRSAHPERVLVRSARVTPFVAVCAGLAFLNVLLLLMWNGAGGAVVLLALDAAAAGWYAWRPDHRTATSDLVLLGKYPAFALLIAGPSTWFVPHAWLAALAIYAGACVFEVWHDATGPLNVWFNQ